MILDKGPPIVSGGFAEVHKAELAGKRVCVKALRLYAQDTTGVAKKVRLYFRPSLAAVTGTPGN